MRLGALLVPFALVLATPSATRLMAEQQSIISGSNGPQALCSVCASTDLGSQNQCSPRTVINYCACRSAQEPTWRVLVRATPKAPWGAFDTYLNAQLQNLGKRLKSKRRPKKQIQRALNQLKNSLLAKYRGYLSSCQPANSGDSGGTTGGGGNPDVVFERGGYSIRLLSYRDKKHTYAIAITETGKILGGAFQQDPQSRAPLQPHTFSSQEVSKQEITPLVWTSKGAKRACETCPLGLQPTDLNNQGQAVGTQISQDVSRPSGFIFNYMNETLTSVPETTGKSHTLAAINDAGLVIGSVQTGLSKSVPQFPLYDAAVWVGVGSSGGGSMNVIGRAAVISAHDNELAGYMLEQIKAQLKEDQDYNECGDAEINQTTLVGKPTYADVTSISGIDITPSGDILGTIISEKVSWNYTNPCKSDVGLLPVLHSSFVRKTDGSIFVSPVAVMDKPTRPTAIPIGLMSNLTAVGLGLNGETIRDHGFVQLSQPSARWRHVEYSGTPPLATVAPMGLNERSEIVGSYFASNTDRTARAYAILGGTFTDLTSLLGNQNEWRIETASDINLCGQIVGRAVNTLTGVNRAVLISPKGCGIS